MDSTQALLAGAAVIALIVYRKSKRCLASSDSSCDMDIDPTVSVPIYRATRGQEKQFLRGGHFTSVSQNGRFYHYKLPSGHYVASNKDYRAADIYERL